MSFRIYELLIYDGFARRQTFDTNPAEGKEKVNVLTREEIPRMAEIYFKPGNWVLTLKGNRLPEQEKFQKIMDKYFWR